MQRAGRQGQADASANSANLVAVVLATKGRPDAIPCTLACLERPSTLPASCGRKRTAHHQTPYGAPSDVLRSSEPAATRLPVHIPGRAQPTAGAARPEPPTTARVIAMPASRLHRTAAYTRNLLSAAFPSCPWPRRRADCYRQALQQGCDDRIDGLGAVADIAAREPGRVSQIFNADKERERRAKFLGDCLRSHVFRLSNRRVHFPLACCERDLTVRFVSILKRARSRACGQATRC
ncbi:hypothetical protein LMG24235_07263 [Paraburkholderia sabiae]|nr:hypothetical protein LMG24235_07263 [Paraburkholderia sabiae]